MKASEKGLALIRSFEGLRLLAYKGLGGVVTIGYGATLDVKMGMEITTEPPIRPHQRRPCCHGRAAFNPSGGHHILATSGAARYPRDRAYARHNQPVENYTHEH